MSFMTTDELYRTLALFWSRIGLPGFKVFGYGGKRSGNQRALDCLFSHEEQRDETLYIGWMTLDDVVG